MRTGAVQRKSAYESSWEGRIANLIDPHWRKDEWFPEALLFNGDPDNPNTTVSRCGTPGCSGLTRMRVNPRCNNCTQLRKLHDDDREFLSAAANSREGWRNFLLGDPPRDHCKVRRFEKRCARQAFAQGVCSTHWAGWKRQHRDDWPDITIWAERGVAAVGATKETTALESLPNAGFSDVSSKSDHLCLGFAITMRPSGARPASQISSRGLHRHHRALGSAPSH